MHIIHKVQNYLKVNQISINKSLNGMTTTVIQLPPTEPPPLSYRVIDVVVAAKQLYGLE